MSLVDGLKMLRQEVYSLNDVGMLWLAPDAGPIPRLVIGCSVQSWVL
jgi:hypothetical protein